MQKIAPCLRFNNNTEEAVNFYTSLFKNSKIGKTARYDAESSKESGMPEGSILTITFQIEGQDFMALNGGPIFKFTPATSFFVHCETESELDSLYTSLVEGGSVLMELGTYPFAEKYAWISDRFGISRQLILTPGSKQKIAPCLLFVGKQHGKAEIAINMYTNLFDNSNIEMIARYEEGEDTPGTIKHGKFSIEGYQMIAMDSSYAHKFQFSQAISFMVECETQEEIDKYRDILGESGEFQPCGRLIDKFGVAWQIVPRVLGELLSAGGEKAKRVMHAMLQMSKLHISDLEKAARGE